MLSACRAPIWRATRLLFVGLLLVLPAAGEAPASSPALVLVGAGVSQTKDLTIEDLAAMPQVTVHTENEFSDGEVDYTGPLVRDVLAVMGLDRLEAVRFVAANDYFVDIPTTDFADYDVILAMTADGKALSRRSRNTRPDTGVGRSKRTSKNSSPRSGRATVHAVPGSPSAASSGSPALAR